MLWHSFVSIWLWFTLITSPFICLYDDFGDSPTMFYMLWFNELVWILDMLRKFFDKPKKSRARDVYEVAVEYIKSTLILDVIASLPQLVSGMNPSFAAVKIIRLYQVWLLHYPLEVIVNLHYSSRDKRQIFVVVYAYQTLCRILMLLHYLAIAWLWLGSSSFDNYEEGLVPWIRFNEDFAGYSIMKLYIFSVYWVCTVVTTVGYGDYYGATTIEYLYTIFLEFFGLVVFSVLQVAVLQLVNHDASFNSYITEKDTNIIYWLKDLERSNFPDSLPEELYESIKLELTTSFRRDFSLIVDEFAFYHQMSPKL